LRPNGYGTTQGQTTQGQGFFRGKIERFAHGFPFSFEKNYILYVLKLQHIRKIVSCKKVQKIPLTIGISHCQGD
jgi:hypothetical protein